jgi:hypothetical protein
MKELKNSDLPDIVSETVVKRYGYEYKSKPEATSENMQIYMNKINELVVEVNRLTELNKKLQ